VWDWPPGSHVQEAATLIDLLGHDGGIDRGVMKAQEIESQVRHEMLHKKGRQREQELYRKRKAAKDD
jgi:hypothetical protein